MHAAWLKLDMVFGCVHGTSRLYLMHASTFAVRTSRFVARALTFAVSHDKILDKIHSLYNRIKVRKTHDKIPKGTPTHVPKRTNIKRMAP